MAISKQKTLNIEDQRTFITLLKSRFEQNTIRHPKLDWQKIQEKLESNPEKVWSLFQMEQTGGEPDVVDYDATSNEYIFFDCAAESPQERRSFCYDREALSSRKEHKPKNSAVNAASEMGIDLLNEQQYRFLQQLGNFDTKTSSWIATPEKIRKLGGAIFADFRFDTVFVYHNGASSYYAVRGFRGSLRV